MNNQSKPQIQGRVVRANCKTGKFAIIPMSPHDHANVFLQEMEKQEKFLVKEVCRLQYTLGVLKSI